MHLLVCLVAVGSLASAAAAPRLLFPDGLVFDKRDDDPATKCHESCGYTILNSRKDGYCSDAAWAPLLKQCLGCALAYDNIWRDYGGKVGAAANKCGLDATPVAPGGGQPSGAASSPAAVTTATATATAQPAPTAATHHSAQQQGAGASASGSTVSSAAGSAVSTASAPVASGGGASTRTSAAPSSTSVRTSGGSRASLGGTLMAGAAVLFAATIV